MSIVTNIVSFSTTLPYWLFGFLLFIKKSATSFTIILVYVDDLVLAGNDIYEINNLKQVLDTSYNIKDLGHLKYFLGFEISRTASGISLCQRKYCLDLLQQTSLLAAKTASTHMDMNHTFHTATDTPMLDPKKFKSLIG